MTRNNLSYSNMKSVIVIYLFLACLFTEAKAQVAVIANESVADAKISPETLVDIYSLEEDQWEDGTDIVLVDFKGNSDIKKVFYKFLGRPANSVKRNRLRILLAGEGEPPILTKKVEDVVDKVKSIRGAIGYVPLDLVPEEGVRIVVTIQ